MYSPEQNTFNDMIAKSDLVPVHRTIVADLETPLTLFAKVAALDPHAFLFESMEGGEKWGRYSFIGLDPLVTFTSNPDQVCIEYPWPRSRCSILLASPGSTAARLDFSATTWFGSWKDFHRGIRPWTCRIRPS